jgi:hypothetical protein
LQILYLDSLVVDEPVATDEECPIRAAAWNDRLIQNVMHKESKGTGEFGKLRVSVFQPVNLFFKLFWFFCAFTCHILFFWLTWIFCVFFSLCVCMKSWKKQLVQP